MQQWQFITIVAALSGAVQAASLKGGFMLTNDEPSTFEDPPLIPNINTTSMSEWINMFEEPEGGTSPMGNMPGRPEVEWSDKSNVPKPVQWAIGSIWVLMLASLPFIIPLIDQKPVTKTQMVVGGSMLVVLFGGFYLFTNIILFQSVHFKTIRPLTIVECIYFMSQLITTVGYGDIGPAKTRGQVFVGLYVLGALFVIGMLVSDATAHVAKGFADYKARRAQNLADQDARVIDINSLIKPVKPSAGPFLSSLAVFAVIDVCWIAFFSLAPGEQKNVFQATYMSVITLSTVGLGWFTPLTEAGMIFGAFFMIFGSTALLSVIGNFTELMVKMQEYERCAAETKEEVLKSLHATAIADGNKDVSELEFYKFSLLHCGVSQDALDHVGEAFKHLNPNEKSGAVSLEAVHRALKEAPLSSRPAAAA